MQRSEARKPAKKPRERLGAITIAGLVRDVVVDVQSKKGIVWRQKRGCWCEVMVVKRKKKQLMSIAAFIYRSDLRKLGSMVSNGCGACPDLILVLRSRLELPVYCSHRSKRR
jgi:hypothetical protein